MIYMIQHICFNPSTCEGVNEVKNFHKVTV